MRWAASTPAGVPDHLLFAVQNPVGELGGVPVTQVVAFGEGEAGEGGKQRPAFGVDLVELFERLVLVRDVGLICGEQVLDDRPQRPAVEGRDVEGVERLVAAVFDVFLLGTRADQLLVPFAFKGAFEQQHTDGITEFLVVSIELGQYRADRFDPARDVIEGDQRGVPGLPIAPVERGEVGVVEPPDVPMFFVSFTEFEGEPTLAASAGAEG